MSDLVDFGPWRVEVQSELTRKAYDSIASGGPDECSCNTCRNWVALRSELYDRALRAALDPLGIDPAKEVEVYHNARLDSGLHSYGGWWHFVGRIEADAGGWWSPPDVALRLMVVEHTFLRAPAFATLPVIAVELYAEVRWALDEPEPQ